MLVQNNNNIQSMKKHDDTAISISSRRYIFYKSIHYSCTINIHVLMIVLFQRQFILSKVVVYDAVNLSYRNPGARFSKMTLTRVYTLIADTRNIFFQHTKKFKNGSKYFISFF